jgi:hypothetical protein
MKTRCRNEKQNSAYRYVNRGITIDPLWEHFPQFFADMGERPSGHSLDRINNDLGYSKDNCRWATQQTQCNNKRSNRLLTSNNGITHTLAEWSRLSGVSYGALKQRLNRGMAIDEATVKPLLRW